MGSGRIELELRDGLRSREIEGRGRIEVELGLGVPLREGGVHPAWGTRNAVLAIGARTYLEVIGPDPEVASGPPPTLFGIDRLTEPRLVSWAISVSGIEEMATRARAAGWSVGSAVAGRRVRPDGSVLEWTLSDPLELGVGSLVPFLIDWGGGAHPADGWDGAAELLELAVTHPRPAALRRGLHELGASIAVEAGAPPRLRAQLRTPSGEAELA